MSDNTNAEVENSPTTPPAAVEDAETFDDPTEKTTFFHGVNLRTQPVLTKRGRKTGKIVSRVFVILEGACDISLINNVSIPLTVEGVRTVGYLFYFQHPAAPAPCGVLALQNAEYFVHSYASSALLGNFCIELRSPLRAWGKFRQNVYLHHHPLPEILVFQVPSFSTSMGIPPWQSTKSSR